MSDDYQSLIHVVSNSLWAIEAGAASRMLAVLERRLRGIRLSADERQELIEVANLQFYSALPMGRDTVEQAPAPSHVQVMKLVGTMRNRLGAMEESSGGGGISTTRFCDQLHAAANNPGIASILILVDSPGGEVNSTPELHQLIADTARAKNVTCFVQGTAASAAYWAISGATEIVASKSSEIGSIGVICVHEDVSQMLKRVGISPTVMTAGPRKAELSPFQPLTVDAKRNLQTRIDAVYRDFVRDVAIGRNKSMAEVEASFGSGGMLSAAQAKGVGAIDRVDSWQSTLQRVARTRPVQSTAIRQRATTDRPAIAATRGGMDLAARKRRAAFNARRIPGA